MATRAHVPSLGELSDVLATILAGAAGGSKATWVKRVGPVEKLPIATNARCNWRVRPRAKPDELDVIDRAVEIVRAEHPYVAG